MDSTGQTSVQGSSEQQHRHQHDKPDSNILPSQRSPFRNTESPATESPPTISSKYDNPHFTHSTSLATDNSKNIAFVTPQFTIPPLPSSLPRRRSTSPDTRSTPNPARQIFSYPMSFPQDAPREYQMQQQHQQTDSEDGPPPSQRRKLSSPDKQGRTHRSDEDSESRRGSQGKGAMSYDPVHEYHQSSHPHHHSRRPSSANSQRSHLSSYSALSSNPEADESTSPTTGDQSMSRDGKKRKHKCQECGQYFTRLHNLKSHLLTHSQEKPFICQECGHKFRRLHDLKRKFLKFSYTECRTSQVTYW